LFSKPRIEFEGKGKLLEVAQKETSLKKCCPHCGFEKVHRVVSKKEFRCIISLGVRNGLVKPQELRYGISKERTNGKNICNDCKEDYQ